MIRNKIKGIISFLLATILMGSSVSAATLPVSNEITYQEITAENEDYFSQSKEKVDEITGLTDSEVLDLFNEYMSQQPTRQNSLFTKTVTKQDVNGFIEYAVNHGIIEDTPQAKASLGKAFYRAQFKIAASLGKAAGLKTAAMLLEHSLQDNPANKSFASGTEVSNQIKNSSEFEDIMTDYKDYVTGRKLSAYTTSGSTTLNSTEDLHMAFNKVSYVASGTKTNGTWKVTIKFKDTYNFEKAAWGSMGGEIVTIINNYAVGAQEAGAIVPYEISITVIDSFTE